MGCDGSKGPKGTRPCCLCKKEISDSLKTVKNHALRVHIKPLRCNLCGLRFGKPYELNRHSNINGRGACKGKQPPQFSDPGSHTKALADKINKCKDKYQIDKALLNANRGHLHGCNKPLPKADREHLNDRKHVDSDQDGDCESDPEYTEHTETHISNGPPPGETLQTETLVSEYGDNIMDLVPAGEFDRVLGHITPNLDFDRLILDYYIDQACWQAALMVI